VLVVTAVAAGLALAGDDDPEDLDVVGPSTTTTVPTTTTTLGVTPPTVEATGTTTTAPPPPPNDVRSVIVSIDGVLGWWDGTRFVSPSEGLSVPVVGGERYTIVGLDGTTTAVGSAPEEGCELPGQQVTIDLGIERPSDRLDPGPISITGVPDPAPRSPTVLASQQVYVDAAVAGLRGLGVEDPSPDLVQVLRVDLDGDARDEVLLVAERMSDTYSLLAAPGDYSVVLLRQVIDEEVVTSVVYSSVAEADPEFTPYVGFARLAAMADLDGDGTMEVVFAAFGYEGTQMLASRVLPTGGAEQVLDNYCGA
jgi:hypothetical protein